MAPSPKEVFDDPKNHWGLITTPKDDDIENQWFDRKEAGRINPANGTISKSSVDGIRDHIKESISAFSNENLQGGLLILGVSSDGSIAGLSHLDEAQVNSLTNFGSLLKNQVASHKFVPCANQQGDPDSILLIYAPWFEYGICETLENFPKAWFRSGPQNLAMTINRRKQIERDKRIISFEEAYCAPFNSKDVDNQIVEEFRKVFLADSSFNNSLEDLLIKAGALIESNDGLAFNNAGCLFFCSNPQRWIPWSYIRLLRFEVEAANYSTRGLSSYERKFDGALPQQIRKLRAFFNESGFFKVYQRRAATGGFIEEPEFPLIAVDEAIVNAVAHRDYGTQMPIQAIHYIDSFYVENPGRIIQIYGTPPEKFSLDEYELRHTPRNPKLIEWLKSIRNEDGSAFVKALSEGTQQMRVSMAGLNLPPPQYETTPRYTSTLLYNNAKDREARFRASNIASDVTEFINLFEVVIIDPTGNKQSSDVIVEQRREILGRLSNALESNNWYVDRMKFGALTAHKKGRPLKVDSQTDSAVSFFQAYRIQFREHWGQLFLSIDYRLEVKNILSVADLIRNDVSPIDIVGKRAVARVPQWHTCRILEVAENTVQVQVYDLEETTWVNADLVIPELPNHTIQQVLLKHGSNTNLPLTIKQFSLSAKPGSARRRAELTLATAQELADNVFPLNIGNNTLVLDASPIPLTESIEADIPFSLTVLSEPAVEFSQERESPDIREGITNFGAYGDDKKTIELIPVCTSHLRDEMASLIRRLQSGQYKYKGSERTFGARLTYRAISTAPNAEAVVEECQRLLDENPEWSGDSKLERIFLVHTPKAGYDRDDVSAPYYRIKRLLFERGIPCQMLDTTTIMNADWKDLNLALNITAKCGITPWILPNRIPDADFFVGLSYTQSREFRSTKFLGYATVFNRFGRWEYYTGKPGAIPFEEKGRYFAELTKETLSRLNSLPESPSIHFHYSSKFSKDDMEAILKAAREIRPNGTYSFVWINSHHNLRLYDSRPDTDGSVSRGGYVALTQNQLLISTTGSNPFRKALGTPKPLEITVRTIMPDGSKLQEPDLRTLAVQILSLTKLNWASTDSITAEPITTKYARDIAYLTDAFLRQGGDFKLHDVLASTPWFI